MSKSSTDEVQALQAQLADTKANTSLLQQADYAADRLKETASENEDAAEIAELEQILEDIEL